MIHHINSITIQQGVSYGTVEGKLVRFADQQRSMRWLPLEAFHGLVENNGLIDGTYQVEPLSVEVRTWDGPAVTGQFQTSDIRRHEVLVITEQEKETNNHVNYYHVPYNVECPFQACRYFGPDNEFHLTWKGPDTIRVCPKCGNGHVIATTTSASAVVEVKEEERESFKSDAIFVKGYYNAKDLRELADKLAPDPAHSEESQEELWKEVSDAAFEYIPSQHRYLDIESVQRKFTIQRRKQEGR